MAFTVVGDEHVGGVVDDATVEGDAGALGDPDLATFLRESMLAMVFRPPPRGGTVTVRYPFHFADTDEPDP